MSDTADGTESSVGIRLWGREKRASLPIYPPSPAEAVSVPLRNDERGIPMGIPPKLGEIMMVLVCTYKYLGEVMGRFPCVLIGWVSAPTDAVNFLAVFGEACVDNAFDFEFFIRLGGFRGMLHWRGIGRELSSISGLVSRFTA